MITRSLAVAIATATMLLAGCQTPTQQGFLAPDKRDQTPYVCANVDDCYVRVDPSRMEWVPENIKVYKGKRLVLWLNNDGVFEDTPVTFKAANTPIDCGEKNKLIVKCKVGENAGGPNYGYTINVKERPPYDPFIWPN
jgi:hypothetical protein